MGRFISSNLLIKSIQSYAKGKVNFTIGFHLQKPEVFHEQRK